jgi:hypothetical protein
MAEASLPLNDDDEFSRDRTLHLTGPIGRTLRLSLVFLMLFLGTGEVIVRTHWFHSHVVPMSWGSRHSQFELQLGRLETMVARDGPIDCLMIGSSMVWHGFDPQAFGAAYQRQTGQKIRCFNFGVDALPAAAAAPLAKVLIQKYQPKLLIYGTDARDYAVPIESEDASVILDTPWIRYRLGHFTIEGWLYDHLYLLRYRETISSLLRFEDQYLLLTGSYALRNHDNYGLRPDHTVGSFVMTPPDLNSSAYQIRDYVSLLQNYKMRPENLAALKQLIQLQNDQLQVLVVEMPVPPTYMYFFGQGQQDYQRFINQLDTTTAAHAAAFWPTTSLSLIPEQGWVDYSHLNTNGAAVFSDWLGQQVGAAVNHKDLKDPDVALGD